MIEQTVIVILNGKNVKYFKELGYEIPTDSTCAVKMQFGYKKGSTIEVKTEHLSGGSKSRVKRTCDKCKRIDFVIWRDMGSKEFCNKCSKSVNLQGMGNHFFGKTHTAETIQKIKGANPRKLSKEEVINFIEKTGFAPSSQLTCGNFGVCRGTIMKIINESDRRDLLFKHMGSSSFENSLVSFIAENYTGPIKTHDRTILGPKELDIVLPELKIAFEFNGLFWHSEERVGKKYHQEKFQQCAEQGIQLFTIWEHIYNRNLEAVEQFILNLISPKPQIYARKCEVIEGSEVKAFIKKWHLQGTVPAHTFLGLKHAGEVVMALSISDHHRKGPAVQVLSRVCFSKYTVVGGLERLLKRCPKPLLTWSDNCYSPLGTMYLKHGFVLERELHPDYFYSRGDGTYFSKQSQAKKKVDCPANLTEKEFAKSKGLFRIWDCGKRCWILA